MTGTIHVIATTLDGTRAALKAAIPTAIRQGARVVLIIPRTPADIEQRPSMAARALISRYDDMLESLQHPVQMRLCLALNGREAVGYLIPDRATVFIGGAVRVWWPSPEERLAAKLRRSGRQVVFIGCNGGEARTKTGVLSHA